MKMRILMSAVVLGVGLLSGEMVETEAATQPVNINTFILVEYGNPAYARQGPFYFRYWPGSSPNTNYDLSVTKLCGQPVDQAAHSSARASANVGAGADRPYSR
jgi:hypothetical protein